MMRTMLTRFQALLLAGVLAAAGPVLAEPFELGAMPMDPPTNLAHPPLPDTGTFPTQLVLDDDSAEGSFGFLVGGARQFMWMNRFFSPGSFTLEEVWVLFPNNADVPVGGTVQLAVYRDADSNPANGATLLGTYDVTIQAKDGDTFSVYPLAPTLEIDGGGTILIGVVNRYFVSGIPPTLPAAYDSNTSQNSSYFAFWAGNAPDPPDLSTADTVDLLTGIASGNFMIRGFGTQATAPIPTMDNVGLLLLGLFLAIGGAVLLRRS